ncbi:MAG: serine protease [Ktedonobacteraceae bacterium]|nr:serine protease [Ktedonobacteraceae bacterium]
MGSWSSISEEVNSLNRPDGYDIVRRQKIDVVKSITGRHLIIYATDFTTQHPLKAQLTSNLVAISLADKDGFNEITRTLPRGAEVDILLHSAGGSAEATESIVELLRARFSKVRFIIPNVAKSAATMMAMAGEQLLLDECSELGPTDPQMILVRDGQVIVAPAQAIIDQFETAQEEVNVDPNKLPAWVPILREYGPSLLAQCNNHLALARELVSKWLSRYMFAGDPEAASKAKQIAEYLADHNKFHSHARRVGITDLQSLGANVLDMRTCPELQTAIHDLYIAIMLTFLNTGAYKIFENSQREAVIGLLQLGTQPANTGVQQQPGEAFLDSSKRPQPRNRSMQRQLAKKK